MRENELASMAIEAKAAAYAPYSGYKVGAALLTKSGKVYTGANIENASFSPTVCAERAAFFKAINDGECDFSMIAIAGGKGDSISSSSPCGVCRQVMAEFCDDNFKILVLKCDGGYDTFTLKELLPFSFRCIK